MKRTILLSLVSAIALTGFVSAASAAEKKQLYFVANGAVDFWKLAEAGMKKAQAELPNYTVQIKYPEQSTAAVQNRLMDDLVASGAAGIIVSSVDPKTQTDALDRVASQALLFTADSDAPQSKRVAYIGSSNRNAGHQAAEILKKNLPNGGKCVAFAGLPGADLTHERLEGIKEGLQDTKIDIVDVRSDEMDQTRAKSNVADILTARSDINCMIGVFAYNTPQIYLALQEAGRLGDVTVVGFDNDQATLGGIKAGAIAGTVVQEPFEWGYQGMKDLARYLDGEKSFVPNDGLIIIPTQIIDKSNVDAFTDQVKAWMSGK